MPTNAAANRGLLILIASAAALALGMLAALWLQKPKTITLQSGTLLQAPRPLGEFAAVDQDGAPVGRAQFEGHWTLIFPGFTSCPDICPTTLALLKNVHGSLGDDAAKLRVTLLSVDPERDTPERLKQYVHYFDPSFTGLSTTPENLKTVAQMFGIAYVKVPGATPETYTMDHSAALIVVDPQARIAAYLTPPFDVTKLGADLRTIIHR